MRNNKDVDDLRSWKVPTEFALPLAVISTFTTISFEAEVYQAYYGF